MSQFLRKLGRGISGSDEPSTKLNDQPYSSSAVAFEDDDLPDYALAHSQHHAGRAGSEPSEQLLSSIPLHLRTTQRASPVRYASDAGSHFPASSDPQLTTSAEPEVSAKSVDALGLRLVHSPRTADVDFIFVHGLGGSSLKTWSFRRDPKNFWPLWLTQEPELSHVRLFSYGYNANFRGGSTSLHITDFAKDLLFQMLTFAEDPSTGTDAKVGQHPIVFIAHSMGGLVVKKAYIWGKHDERYSSVIAQVRSITFLATPHRGSSYAKVLNSILDASPFGTSRKEYIAQLEPTSSQIQDINDQFRTVCADLVLVSFYETMKTSFAKGVKRTIVEKASAVLDYPQEHSSPLNADHHGICKFENSRDGNYVCVRNMLKLVTSKLSKRKRVERPPSNVEVTKRLEDVLGIRETPEQDYNAYKERLSEGSCEWILRKQLFQDWVDGSDTDPQIFWLTGPPATGKSTLASFVINWIKNGFLDNSCQYHFFLSDHQVKKTVAYFLRTIAFQLAQSYDVIREALLRLNDETNATFGTQSIAIIWEKIFEGIVFRVPLADDLFWVLDALDEADAAVTLCNLFSKVRSVNRIKLFITSRRTKELSNVLNSQSEQIVHETITPTDTSGDIRAYVTRAVRANLPQDEKDQDHVIEQILEKANGSFLWVKLTLDTMRDNWHTQEDIRRAMVEIPQGMESLYTRMLTSVTSQATRNREIAQEILTWAVCSFRPLYTAELRAALLPKFDGFVSLEDTVGRICGHFIQVTNDQITLVHATARYFLLNKSDGFVSKHESHEHLAITCLRYLSDDNWKHVFTLTPKEIAVTDRVRLSDYSNTYPFLAYAVHHWAYHLNKSVLDSDTLFEVLEAFFNGYVLAWIHGVVLSQELRTLTRSAQYIRGFIHRKSRMESETNEPPLSLHIQDPRWLRLWAIDLIRILGKFGRILLQSPTSIYRLIPVFCPPQSQIGAIYGRPRDLTISLSGFSSTTWDDCLARVGGSEDETISRVIATDTYFITLMRSSGKAMVWSAETCEELRRINHGEYVTHMAIDKLGTTLATAGMLTIRTWEISSGQEIYLFPRNSEAKTMTMAFSDSSEALLIGREDYSIQTHDISSGRILSTFWAYNRQEAFQNCPRLMVLSPGLGKVAVAERGKPVLIWDLHRPAEQQPWRCVRTEDLTRHLDDQEAWNAPEIVCWNPEGTSIFILYQDENVVHWSFIEDTQREYSHTGAREMVVSKDGNFLLTSDSSGTLSVWTLPQFNLIYKLYYEEFVRDLVFSPDGRRIYDSRGPVCNVWEPDVLIRHEDDGRDDASSNYEYSILSDPVISQNDSSRSQVTALACDSADRYYCCGKDDGSVAIHSASNGERTRKVYNHSTTVSVIALAWSESGRYIASGDDAGRVICKRLEVKEGGKWAVFPVFDIRLKVPVRQFLFNTDESLLLVSTESMDILWNLRPKTKQEICRKARDHFTGRRWRNHPFDSSRLIWVDPTTTMAFNWANLERSQAGSSKAAEAIDQSHEDHRPSLQTTPSASPDTVRCVSQTRNGRHLVIEIVPDTGSARSLAPHGLKVQRLLSTSISSPSASSTARIPLTELAVQASRVLGIFQDRILFLDRMFWVCSCEMSTETVARAAKRHFFLPGDWVNPASLALVTYNEQGTVFCPRNGEVAIVRNGIRL